MKAACKQGQNDQRNTQVHSKRRRIDVGNSDNLPSRSNENEFEQVSSDDDGDVSDRNERDNRDGIQLVNRDGDGNESYDGDNRNSRDLDQDDDDQAWENFSFNPSSSVVLDPILSTERH